MTRLEHDWESPVWQHSLEALGARFTVIRYDERGCGLSDRTPPALGLDLWMEDLQAVADAAGVEHFALLGMSQGGAIATAYAARCPDRVSHLILHGAYARGQLRRDDSTEAREKVELARSVIRLGWGRPDPVFRRIFTSRFIPGASEEQMRWFDEREQRSASPEMAARLAQARAEVVLPTWRPWSGLRRWSCTPVAMKRFLLRRAERWPRSSPVRALFPWRDGTISCSPTSPPGPPSSMRWTDSLASDRILSTSHAPRSALRLVTESLQSCGWWRMAAASYRSGQVGGGSVDRT